MSGRTVSGIALVVLVGCAHASLRAPTPDRPLFTSVDLDTGESRDVLLSDGRRARVKLLGYDEAKDGLRAAIRAATVRVLVNGKEIALASATYHLPVTVAGVQIDCPVTRGLNQRTQRLVWGLKKDVRLRLWPAGSPWYAAGAFRYPARQRWFATDTQMANEPSFVDEGEGADPTAKVYYHFGLDIGGSEGDTEIVAATDGVVVAREGDVLPADRDGLLGFGAAGTVWVRNPLGLYLRYSHLREIEPGVRPGAPVKIGQRLGRLGKEGDSGGWAHLHFQINARQDSGEWGVLEGYAFLWEAYLRERHPAVIAVARPHLVAAVGEKARLDGSRSWAASGTIARYDWSFSDGTSAQGVGVDHRYDRPGVYSEILKVTDDRGRIAYDFASVHVRDRDKPEAILHTINANFTPTLGLEPGDPVTFRVRTFGTTEGHETWNFGDGTPRVEVTSDGNVKPQAPGYAETVHRFAKPGHYVVSVERRNEAGVRASTHLYVPVGVAD